MYKSFRDMSKPMTAMRNPINSRSESRPTGQLSLPKQTKIFMQRLIDIYE
jgi:hypothetical protein